MPPISDRAELMLVFAARTQHLDEVITPALESGKWVLCDRFTDATYAYQGGGRGIDHDAIETLEQWVQGKLQPDLTVLLDVPVEVGLARTRQRGDHPGLPRDARDQMVISLRRSGTHDRFERQALEFKQAVRRVYLERAARFESRIKLVDANKTIEQVRTDLKVVLETFWQQHKTTQATVGDRRHDQLAVGAAGLGADRRRPRYAASWITDYRCAGNRQARVRYRVEPTATVR